MTPLRRRLRRPLTCASASRTRAGGRWLSNRCRAPGRRRKRVSIVAVVALVVPRHPVALAASRGRSEELSPSDQLLDRSSVENRADSKGPGQDEEGRAAEAVDEDVPDRLWCAMRTVLEQHVDAKFVVVQWVVRVRPQDVQVVHDRVLQAGHRWGVEGGSAARSAREPQQEEPVAPDRRDRGVRGRGAGAGGAAGGSPAGRGGGTEARSSR